MDSLPDALRHPRCQWPMTHAQRPMACVPTGRLPAVISHWYTLWTARSYG